MHKLEITISLSIPHDVVGVDTNEIEALVSGFILEKLSRAKSQSHGLTLSARSQVSIREEGVSQKACNVGIIVEQHQITLTGAVGFAGEQVMAVIGMEDGIPTIHVMDSQVRDVQSATMIPQASTGFSMCAQSIH